MSKQRDQYQECRHRKVEPNTMSQVNEAWKRIETCLQDCWPEALETFLPGADDQQLKSFERSIEKSLPDDVKDWFRVHNGQQAGVNYDFGVCFGLNFMSLESSLRDQQRWRNYEDMNREFDGMCSSEPEGAIQLGYTFSGWIPLLRWPGSSNFIGVDLNPGPFGMVGQVINFGRDECYEKTVLAKRWGDFLEFLASEFEADKLAFYEVDDGAGGMQRNARHASDELPNIFAYLRKSCPEVILPKPDLIGFPSTALPPPAVLQILERIARSPQDGNARRQLALSIRADRETYADLIDVQLELDGLDEKDSARASLAEREAKLLQDLAEEWPEALWVLDIKPNDVGFRRGMIEELTIRNIYKVTESGGIIHAIAPTLRSLTLNNLTNALMGHALDVEKLLGFPGFERLETLQLFSCNLRGPSIQMLADSPKLKSLSKLEILMDEIGDEGVEALSASPNLANLRILSLDKVGMTDRGVKALAQSRSFPKLSELRMIQNKIGKPGAIALAESSGLTNLQSLGIETSELGKATTLLLQERFGEALSVLPAEEPKTDEKPSKARSKKK